MQILTLLIYRVSIVFALISLGYIQDTSSSYQQKLLYIRKTLNRGAIISNVTFSI